MNSLKDDVIIETVSSPVEEVQVKEEEEEEGGRLKKIGRRYEWEESDTVPGGWKVRVGGESCRSFILSPDGTQYASRLVALQDLSSRSADPSVLEELRQKMVEHEKWERSELLPPGWLFRVTWEGRKSSSLSYLSREGVYFQSMRTAREYMEVREGYGEEDGVRCEQFLEEVRRSRSRLKYEWEEGDQSLPTGWSRRVAEGRAGTEFILSPDGEQFKTRFAALMTMYRTHADLVKIEEMKSKLSCEGWDGSELLPEGWLYRRAWEGFGRSGRTLSTTLYLSREGQCYDSVRAATEFIDSTEGYYRTDTDNLKRLHKSLGNAFTKTRSDWLEDAETLPKLWKRRKSGKVEFFLRPDGSQYKSRVSAVQAMIRDKYSVREINQMRSRLHHEGWTSDKLLPKDWYFKKTLTNLPSRKMTEYSFLSAEGPQFSSMKAARQFMISTENYSKKQITNFHLFMKSEERRNAETSHSWSEAAQLPPGWRTRASAGREGRQYFLSPQGQQFLSLVTAYQHLLKEGLANTADLKKVRTSLAREGWLESKEIPRGWLLKEVKSRCWYINRAGDMFPGAKTALESIEEDSSYTARERKLLRKIVEGAQVNVEEKYNWKSYQGLPPGWRVRRKTSGSRKMIDFFLAPDGKHLRGRNSAVKHLEQLGGSEEEISQMKSFSWFKSRRSTLEERAEGESDISLSSCQDSSVSMISSSFII